MSLWTPPDDPLQTIAPLPRSFFAFAALAAGMIAAREGPPFPSAFWLSLACAACTIALLTRGRACKAALLAGAVFFGGGVFNGRILERDSDTLAGVLDNAGPDVAIKVEGLVLEEPRASVPSGALARFAAMRPRGMFRLSVTRIYTDQGPRKTSGVLRASVPGSSWSAESGLSGFPVRAGQRVRLTGLARQIEGPLNPGEPDFRLYGAQENLAGFLEIGDAALVEVLDADEALPARLRSMFYRAMEMARARARAVLDPGPGADERARALILSLFLGIDETGQREVRRAFTHVGLAHVLAISGFHLTVMAYVALFLLRLTGERGLVEPAIVGALIVLYLVAVPASAPVVRAGLLSLALMGAEARGRRYDALAVLGWAGVALILWRPLDLWGLGFQLSLGLTALLLWIGRYVNSRIFGPTIRGLVRRVRPLHVSGAHLALGHLKSGLSSSLLCWAAATPVIAYRTGLVSPLAVLTTLVVLPPILLLMGAGYVVLIAGIVFPELGAAASGVLVALASLNVALVDAMDALPGSGLRAPPVGAPWAVAATAVVLLWFTTWYARHAGAWVASLAVVLWLAADLALQKRDSEKTVLRIDALAVGDGSCILLRSAGAAVMWDCGSTRVSVGERMIPQSARALGAWRVPTVVVTSPDLAHLSGIVDIVEPLGVERLIAFPAVFADAEQHPEGSAAFVLRELRRMGVEIVEATADDPLRVGSAAIRPLETGAGGTNDQAAWPATCGLVTVADFPHAGALLAAGVDERSLARLLEANPSARAPVVIVSPKAAKALPPFPHVTIISGAARSTGETLPAGSRAGSYLYITGVDGAAWVELDRRGGLRTGSLRRAGPGNDGAP